MLQDAGAVRECEEHGWVQDRADPHARERAFDMACWDPPQGVSPKVAVAAVTDVLEGIGDTCPVCPPRALEPLADRLRLQPTLKLPIRGSARPSTENA